MRILLVEDDVVLRNVMVRSLTDAGHRVDVAETLEQAEHFWLVQPFDTVLLDLNLPLTDHPMSGLGSGLKALRNARQRGDRTPVLILTARNRTDERIAGLDAGADDYIGKPFDLAEVEARLRALVRRSQGTDDREEVALADHAHEPGQCRIAHFLQARHRLRRTDHAGVQHFRDRHVRHIGISPGDLRRDAA